MAEAIHEVVDRVAKVVGYVPHGLGDLLNVLTHPDVIDSTERFVRERSDADR